MKFYVNEILDSDYDGYPDIDLIQKYQKSKCVVAEDYSRPEHEIIGLFGEHKWHGEGCFLSWYGSEYYTDVMVYAIGVRKEQKKSSGFKGPFRYGFHEIHRHYDQVHISSAMCEDTFESDSIEEALEIFRTQSW